MKITVYTITDCEFSKLEKEYLISHTLQFEEKNLETNKEFLTEMLAISNNFAGTPVTKIEKDDGQIIILKGFTKEEFDKELGFVTELPAPPVVTPTPPLVNVAPVTPPVAEVTEPVVNPLNSVMDTLQQKSQDTTPPSPPPTVPEMPPITPSTPPSIPDFKPQ